MNVTITKASGEKEPFEKSKLHQSMLRAGASAILANQIVQEVEKSLTDGMSTKLIYKRAHKLIQHDQHGSL